MGLGPELQAISNGDAVNADKVYGNDQSLREFVTSIPVENLSKPNALATLAFSLEGANVVATTAPPGSQEVWCFGEQRAGLSISAVTQLTHIIASANIDGGAPAAGTQTVTISIEKSPQQDFSADVVNVITLTFDLYPVPSPKPYKETLSYQEILPTPATTNKLVQDAVISSNGTVTAGNYVRAKMYVLNNNSGVGITISKVHVVVTAKTMHQE